MRESSEMPLWGGENPENRLQKVKKPLGEACGVRGLICPFLNKGFGGEGHKKMYGAIKAILLCFRKKGGLRKAIF